MEQLTNNNDFGGVGTGQWSSKQTGSFQYGPRTNLETANDEIRHGTQPTMWRISGTATISLKNSATINATGQFVALGDRGYTSVTKQFNDPLFHHLQVGIIVASLSRSPNMKSCNLLLIHRCTAPTIQRFNATTGALLGTASISTSGCTSQASNYWYDATVDPNGKSGPFYQYYTLAKWEYQKLTRATSRCGEVDQHRWQCSNYYNYGYPTLHRVRLR